MFLYKLVVGNFEMPQGYKNLTGENPFKGRKHSEETKLKNRLAHLGKSAWNKGKKMPETSTRMQGKGNHRFGVKHTEERKKMMSKRMKGKNNPYFGLKHSEEIKEKMRGENNGNWKGGVSTLNHLIRNSQEYRLWQKAVWTRDNWHPRSQR